MIGQEQRKIASGQSEPLNKLVAIEGRQREPGMSDVPLVKRELSFNVVQLGCCSVSGKFWPANQGPPPVADLI